jgi:hypothetical protein
MKTTSITPSVLALAGLVLAPAVAEADSIDCYAPVVAIVSPAPDASFEGVTEIPVTVSVQSEGFDSELARVYVLVDGQEAATMDITVAGEYDLVTPVSEGSHQLIAAASDTCAGDGSSEPVTIMVTAPSGASTGEAGSDSGNGDGGGDDSDGGDDGSGDQDAGCTISRTPTRSWVGLSAFFVMVLGAWRLRRAGA